MQKKTKRNIKEIEKQIANNKMLKSKYFNSYIKCK